MPIVPLWSSVSRLQAVRFQAFPWPDQYTATTGTKAEPAVIRKHNRSPLRSPMSSGLTPQASQTSMAWSRLNIRYMVPGLELSLM
ncbi:uncharacterized protein TNCV_876251 [Trichonephila clavipes]|nr:uncharacterized protein TNCV_876251 [Trichonephila clavipes]